MSYQKEDLIKYRLEKSATTFNEAESLATSGFWGGCANRLYYSCFYCVIALLAKDDVTASTHNGVRTEFFRRYIKTEILDRKYSSLYTDLMSKRQESDYEDFLEFKQEDILPLIKKVDKFLITLREIIEKQ
jgi:uncharacterized protein (UPF0332 family)